MNNSRTPFFAAAYSQEAYELSLRRRIEDDVLPRADILPALEYMLKKNSRSDETNQLLDDIAAHYADDPVIVCGVCDLLEHVAQDDNTPLALGMARDLLKVAPEDSLLEAGMTPVVLGLRKSCSRAMPLWPWTVTPM